MYIHNNTRELASLASWSIIPQNLTIDEHHEESTKAAEARRAVGRGPWARHGENDSKLAMLGRCWMFDMLFGTIPILGMRCLFFIDILGIGLVSNMVEASTSNR